MDISNYIDDIEDFPKKGIIFKDMTRLLSENFQELMEELSKGIDWDKIDCICGVDARGFILGAGLSAIHKKGFIPIRKKGKLPPPIISESYDLEYGSDTLEIKDQESKKRVLLIDDVLATGGTLQASINLCEKAGHTIEEIRVLINLTSLNNLKDKQPNLKSLWNI